MQHTVSTQSEEIAWFALLVRTHRERSVEMLLRHKGFEVFLPVTTETRHYSGKKRHLEVPCFPGYVFCRFDPEDRLPIMTTPDIYRVIGNGKRPEPVPDSEIEYLRLLTSSGAHVERHPYVSVGERVHVQSGPLAGLTGILVGLKGCQRVVVSITLLRRAVAAEVSMSDLSPCRSVDPAGRADMRETSGYAAR